MCNEIVGVNGDEGTPVPIPNTVVKLVYGDNTWLATAREDNSTPTPADRRSARYSSIAQLVEHAAVNRRVVGSSPTGGARRMWLAATAVTASPLFKVVERYMGL